MSYPGADATLADADAQIELAQTLITRFEPFEGTPAATYLTKVRKIPAEAA